MVIFKTQKPFYYMVLQSVPKAEKVAAYRWEKVLEYSDASGTRRHTYPAYKLGTKYDSERGRRLFFFKWHFEHCGKQDCSNKQ